MTSRRASKESAVRTASAKENRRAGSRARRDRAPFAARARATAGSYAKWERRAAPTAPEKPSASSTVNSSTRHAPSAAETKQTARRSAAFSRRACEIALERATSTVRPARTVLPERGLLVKRVGITCLFVATLTATHAYAGAPDRERAKEAYDRGLEAHDRGDLQRAAEEFARADTLAPSAVALQAALDAAVAADEVTLGAELLERSKREPPPPSLASSITAAHLKFNGRAGRVLVLCPKTSTCTARIDDRSVKVNQIAWSPIGQRTLLTRVDGERPSKIPIDVVAEKRVDVSLTRGKPPSVAAPTLDEPAPIDSLEEPSEPSEAKDDDDGRRKKLPPLVFYSGVGLTLVLAATTTYFGLSASSKHSSFEDEGCLRANYPSCEDLKSSGQSNQQLANVGLVLTAASAVATTILGVAFTNWKGPVAAVHPGGGAATWHVTF